MKKQLTVLLALGLMAACGPSSPAKSDGGSFWDGQGGHCVETDCDTSCQAQGYSGGGCSNDTCVCSGQDLDAQVHLTTVTGRVLSPGGLVGISGALVYFSAFPPDPIPDHAYPETCTNPSGVHSLTNPDGTFSMEVFPGSYYLVVQKGQFRRVRQVEVPEGGPMALDEELTTLPNRRDQPGDTIPNIALVWGTGDALEKVFETLGMTGLDVSIWGTEFQDPQFDIYNVSPYESNEALLNNLERMLHYHIIFFPCTIQGNKQLNDPTAPLSDPGVLQNIRDYLQAGGKIFSTDMMYDIFEQPLPEYLDMCGDDSVIDAADHEAWNHNETAQGWTSHGESVDPDLSAWLDAVGFDSSALNLELNFVWIEGMYEEPEHIPGDPEPPHVYVQGDFVLDPSRTLPLTVTFPYGPGKVLFSTYHTVSSSNQQKVRGLIAQEWILVYLIMEIGVCTKPVE